MDVVLAALPVVLLIVAMTSPWPRGRLPLTAHVALPGAALLALAVQAAGVFGATWRGVSAAMIDGLLSALTPLAIVFGAVFFFRVLEASGALGALTGRLRSLSADPVAQLMVVGWSFSFLVEGLSGFGTPAALAAPVLVGLGFPAVRVAAMCLVMNSVPVSFGAVGTPLWFGLGDLGFTAAELRGVGVRAAAVNSAAAPVVCIAALAIVVPWREVRARLGFIVAVTAATVIPYFVSAFWSAEFPSIVGGACGLAAAALLARFGMGLPRRARGAGEGGEEGAAGGGAGGGVGGGLGGGSGGGLRAVLPLIAVVALLGATRLGWPRSMLNAEEPAARLGVDGLGEAWVSAALVVGVRGILGTEASWRMAILYVPFILPFVVVSLLTWPLMRMPRREVGAALTGSVRRLGRPALALAGALVLAKMLVLGGGGSPAMVLGGAMAGAAGEAWPVLAPLLGALGSFFSGSNTVSNLTFGPVQAAIGKELGLGPMLLPALQTAGGAMGNMICIHNIVAVAAVLGLSDKPTGGEPGAVAAVLRRTIGPMLAYAAVAAAMALVLLRIG